MCESLTDFEIPKYVGKADTDSFHGCKSLKKLKLSENFNYVGKTAFRGCTGLTEVDISACNSLNIDGKAFADCTSLKKVTYPANKGGVAGDAFLNTEGIEFIG